MKHIIPNKYSRMKEDRSDKGTPITIENGVLMEEAPDRLMEYVLTDELD